MEEKEIKRFSPVLGSKIIKALTKTLSSDVGITKEKALNEGKELGVMDPANVAMIVGKSEEAKRILARFTNPESNDKVPEIEFSGNKSKFSIDYLTQAIELFKQFNKSGDPGVWITTGKDQPLIIENEHFKFILAPRVED